MLVVVSITVATSSQIDFNAYALEREVIGRGPESASLPHENNSEFLLREAPYEATIYSQATLADDFCPETVIVVKNLRASRRSLMQCLTLADFPEVRNYFRNDVEELTPGLEMARAQLDPMNSSSARSFSNSLDNSLDNSLNQSVDLENYRRIVILRLRNPSHQNVLNKVRRLERMDGILSASPDFIRQNVLPIMDYGYGYSAEENSPHAYAGISPAQASTGHWSLDRINAQGAWSIVGTNSTNIVRVGIMDTGVEASHPGLASRVDTHLFACFLTSNRRPANVLEDPHGHGTMSAGIVGSHGNFASVTQNTNVRIVSLRIWNDVGSGNSSMALTAIQFAAANGIHILNMSGGWYSNWNTYDVSLRASIQAFNGLFVASAGNEGTNNDGNNPAFPASYRLPNLISVGASNRHDQRSVWNSSQSSNFGATTVCIFAPGGNQGTASVENIRTTNRGNGFAWYNGTSSAAPFVAGVAALMLSVTPNLNPIMLRNIIMETADRPSALNGLSISNGRVNAYAAVSAARIWITRDLPNNEIEILGITRNIIGSIEIPNVINGRIVTSIGDFAFFWENGLQGVSFQYGSQVRRIGDFAFADTPNLQNVTLPLNLTHIGFRAFAAARNLESLTLPDSLTSIGSEAFWNTGLRSINIPPQITFIPQGAFRESLNLETVNIQGNVTSISDAAFQNTPSLTNINLPNSLTTIGRYAFQRTGLKEIRIPSSVNSIGSNAFADSEFLHSIHMSRETPPNLINQNAFANTPFLRIYVPNHRLMAYKNAHNWLVHSDIIRPSDFVGLMELQPLRGFTASNHANLSVGDNALFGINAVEGIYRLSITGEIPIRVTLFGPNFKLLESISSNASRTVNLTRNFVGVYYIAVEFIITNGTGRVDLSIAAAITDVFATNNERNILPYLIDGRGRFAFQNWGTRFVEFQLSATGGMQFPHDGIIIRDAQGNIVADNLRQARTREGHNVITAFLPRSGWFYIDIDLNVNQVNQLFLTLSLLEYSQPDFLNTALRTDFLQIAESGRNEQLVGIVLSPGAVINVEIFYSGISSSNAIFVLMQRAGTNITVLEVENISGFSSFTFKLTSGTYYLGFLNAGINNFVMMSVSRIITETGSHQLVTDPSWASLRGSEVTINNGLPGANTITQGFTRLIYLANQESRQNFTWHSSDPNVAQITNYGTVLAMPVSSITNVRIIAICRQNPGRVFYRDLVIMPENSNVAITINHAMTMSRSGGNISLNSVNVPINLIQLYDWSSPSPFIEVSPWGPVWSTAPLTVGQTFTIIGNYQLNQRVTIIITVTIV